MTVVVGGFAKRRRALQSFENCANGSEVRECLKRVLSNTGSTPKREKMLYHYTSVNAAVSIFQSGFLWLSSPDAMNDTLERSCVQQFIPTLFFASFSRSEENMGMYSMYARGADGIMMRVSYEAAQQLLDSLPSASEGGRLVHVVRGSEVTEELVEADVYWSAVCYKSLHGNALVANSVTNESIPHPLAEPELAGFVKLFGWEYEKEVRLCAVTRAPLGPNERVAIRIPKKWKASVITKPGFDRSSNSEACKVLAQYDVSVNGSSYEGLVSIEESQANLSVSFEDNAAGGRTLMVKYG